MTERRDFIKKSLMGSAGIAIGGMGMSAKSYAAIIGANERINLAVIGIRDGKQISIPDFMTVKIPYPPLEQQKQIASVLNTARQEIDLLKKQVEAYHKQKRGLMQKLLTGKWMVKTDEGERVK